MADTRFMNEKADEAGAMDGWLHAMNAGFD